MEDYHDMEDYHSWRYQENGAPLQANFGELGKKTTNIVSDGESVRNTSDFHKTQMDIITGTILKELPPRPYTKSKDKFFDEQQKLAEEDQDDWGAWDEPQN